MNNGQSKPGYNLQTGTENQFISDFALFPNPTDTLMLIPFFNSFSGRYNRMPVTAVADSGYGSEENGRFMEGNKIASFVQYSWFHKEQKRSFKKNPFLVAYHLPDVALHVLYSQNARKASKRVCNRTESIPGAAVRRESTSERMFQS